MRAGPPAAGCALSRRRAPIMDPVGPHGRAIDGLAAYSEPGTHVVTEIDHGDQARVPGGHGAFDAVHAVGLGPSIDRGPVVLGVGAGGDEEVSALTGEHGYGTDQ